MNIFITGLGLIGGSLAKAISFRTKHTVVGYDNDEGVLSDALKFGAIEKKGEKSDLALADVVIVALYPKAAIEFIRENLEYFKDGCILTDTCGIKSEVCTAACEILRDSKVSFIGGHPMAGVEHSGFNHSFESLFDGASMILCPEYCKEENALTVLGDLFLEIGFGRITISDHTHHDRVIAFTSQLAHVVSSAYVHGELATEHKGFSAGSYKDMTRVARLNANMWCELFFENSENLSTVIGELIGNLEKFKRALDSSDKEEMTRLLQCGRERKIKSDNL